MSDDEVESSNNTQYLTAEYKDGRLQIVEVTPFHKENAHILPELSQEAEDETKFIQVLDSTKDMVQLDLLNFTLVRNEDGEESYQLVTNEECAESEADASDNTVTCMVSSDTEEHDNQESYIIVDNDNEQPPLIFLQPSMQQNNQKNHAETKTKVLSPVEILERAKALQRAKAMLSQKPPFKRGRKRKADLPPPHELLSSPNFKLYLYSCKLCSFKCNAIKEMSAHKAAEHSAGAKSRAAGGAGAGGAGGAAGGARGGHAIALQCARCPFRAATHTQLMRHVQDRHLETRGVSEAVALDTEEVRAADVLVCGACGFESACRDTFREHIEDEHGAITC